MFWFIPKCFKNTKSVGFFKNLNYSGYRCDLVWCMPCKCKDPEFYSQDYKKKKKESSHFTGGKKSVFSFCGNRTLTIPSVFPDWLHDRFEQQHRMDPYLSSKPLLLLSKWATAHCALSMLTHSFCKPQTSEMGIFPPEKLCWLPSCLN